jgi:hypothetical protein
MNVKETFDWLVERSNELNAVIEVAEADGIQPPTKGDHRWWVPADPGPIECDSLSEALRERLDLAERELASLRSQLSSMRVRCEDLERRLAEKDEDIEGELLALCQRGVPHVKAACERALAEVFDSYRITPEEVRATLPPTTEGRAASQTEEPIDG